MANSGIDFDEIMVDNVFGDATEEFEAEPVINFEPLRPMAKPVSHTMTSPFPARDALTLVSAPDKLFDFSKTKLTAQQQMYIMQYAVKGTKLGACKGANVPFSVVEKWSEDEEFVESLSNAVEMAKDSLEEELLRRAMNGSDKLLIEAIRALKPEKYGRAERKDVNINGMVVHTWADLASQAKGMLNAVEADYEEVDDGEKA